MSIIPVPGTVWVSPRLLFAQDVSLELISSAVEQVRYDKRDFSTSDPTDWKWMDPEVVESFRWRINGKYDATISVSLDINDDRLSRSEAVALSIAALPSEILGTLDYSVVIDDVDGGYYVPTAHKIVLGYEETVRHLREGFLEEVLVHEIAHATLDRRFYGTLGWVDAVSRDSGRFLSDYAASNPSTEDVAETVLPLVSLFIADPDELNREDKIYLLDSASMTPGRYSYLSQQLFGSSSIVDERTAQLRQSLLASPGDVDPVTGILDLPGKLRIASKRKAKVALLGNQDLDVEDVDVESLRYMSVTDQGTGAVQRKTFTGSIGRVSMRDLNSDGSTDLVLNIRMNAFRRFSVGSMSASIAGELLDGSPIAFSTIPGDYVAFV